VSPTQGGGHMLKAYIAVALGGWGSVPGALLGALAIGVFETVLATWLGDVGPRLVFTSWCWRSSRSVPVVCSASRPGGVRDMRRLWFALLICAAGIGGCRATAVWPAPGDAVASTPCWDWAISSCSASSAP
jgi:hypothetical protein